MSFDQESENIHGECEQEITRLKTELDKELQRRFDGNRIASQETAEEIHALQKKINVLNVIASLKPEEWSAKRIIGMAQGVQMPADRLTQPPLAGLTKEKIEARMRYWQHAQNADPQARREIVEICKLALSTFKPEREPGMGICGKHGLFKTSFCEECNP